MLYLTTSGNEEARSAIFWKDVDEGWIRYDQRSGSTHLFTPLARFVIDFIDASSGPLTSPAIVDEVLRSEPDAQPDECRRQVEIVLKTLSETHLIESMPP